MKIEHFRYADVVSDPRFFIYQTEYGILHFLYHLPSGETVKMDFNGEIEIQRENYLRDDIKYQVTQVSVTKHMEEKSSWVIRETLQEASGESQLEFYQRDAGDYLVPISLDEPAA